MCLGNWVSRCYNTIDSTSKIINTNINLFYKLIYWAKKLILNENVGILVTYK